MAGKKKKITLGFLAIAAAAGIYLYLNLGSLITLTAEKIASDALGVKVNIGSIHVSLGDKTVTVATLEIGNPPGYRKANAMTAKKIIIGLNTASEKLIDFKNIQVVGSVVNLEVNEKGMNLADLKALANKKEQKESVGSEQVRVIVRNMVIDASTINPSISLIDREIPPLHMPAVTYSSAQNNGVAAGEAIVQVMTKYLSAVEKAARQEGLLNGMPGNVDDVKKALDEKVEGLKGLFK